jgi:hypothetical protein
MGASCSNARADDLSPPQDVFTGIPARFCQRNQVRAVPGTDLPAQRAFVHQVFGVAA